MKRLRDILLGVMASLAIISHFAFAAASTDSTKTGIFSLGSSSGSIIYNNGGVVGSSPLYVDNANTVAQRNSTNAQTLYVYNTYTDGSNYERGYFKWSGNLLQIGSEAAGTGTVRNVNVFAGTGGSFGFGVNGGAQWVVNGSGNLILSSNNTYDIGTSVSTASPRTVYAATSMVAPTVQTTSTTVGSLGTCNAGAAGQRKFVTDANATTFASTVAGGGANNVPVYCDGAASAWKIGQVANDAIYEQREYA